MIAAKVVAESAEKGQGGLKQIVAQRSILGPVLHVEVGPDCLSKPLQCLQRQRDARVCLVEGACSKPGLAAASASLFFVEQLALVGMPLHRRDDSQPGHGDKRGGGHGGDEGAVAAGPSSKTLCPGLAVC